MYSGTAHKRHIKETQSGTKKNLLVRFESVFVPFVVRFPISCAKRVFAGLLLSLLVTPGFAQVDLSGEWGQKVHEDAPERGAGCSLPPTIAASWTAMIAAIRLALWRRAS